MISLDMGKLAKCSMPLHQTSSHLLQGFIRRFYPRIKLCGVCKSLKEHPEIHAKLRKLGTTVTGLNVKPKVGRLYSKSPEGAIRQQVADFVIYVSLAAKARKGSAILWYNVHSSGRPALKSIHGGCPVLLGHKFSFLSCTIILTFAHVQKSNAIATEDGMDISDIYFDSDIQGLDPQSPRYSKGNINSQNAVSSYEASYKQRRKRQAKKPAPKLGRKVDAPKTTAKPKAKPKPPKKQMTREECDMYAWQAPVPVKCDKLPTEAELVVKPPAPPPPPTPVAPPPRPKTFGSLITIVFQILPSGKKYIIDIVFKSKAETLKESKGLSDQQLAILKDQNTADVIYIKESTEWYKKIFGGQSFSYVEWFNFWVLTKTTQEAQAFAADYADLELTKQTSDSELQGGVVQETVLLLQFYWYGLKPTKTNEDTPLYTLVSISFKVTANDPQLMIIDVYPDRGQGVVYHSKVSAYIKIIRESNMVAMTHMTSTASTSMKVDIEVEAYEFVLENNLVGSTEEIKFTCAFNPAACAVQIPPRPKTVGLLILIVFESDENGRVHVVDIVLISKKLALEEAKTYKIKLSAEETKILEDLTTPAITYVRFNTDLSEKILYGDGFDVKEFFLLYFSTTKGPAAAAQVMPDLKNVVIKITITELTTGMLMLVQMFWKGEPPADPGHSPVFTLIATFFPKDETKEPQMIVNDVYNDNNPASVTSDCAMKFIKKGGAVAITDLTPVPNVVSKINLKNYTFVNDPDLIGATEIVTFKCAFQPNCGEPVPQVVTEGVGPTGSVGPGQNGAGGTGPKGQDGTGLNQPGGTGPTGNVGANGPGGTGPNGNVGPNGPGGTGPTGNVGPNGPGGTGPNSNVGSNGPGGTGPNSNLGSNGPGGTGPNSNVGPNSPGGTGPNGPGGTGPNGPGGTGPNGPGGTGPNSPGGTGPNSPGGTGPNGGPNGPGGTGPNGGPNGPGGTGPNGGPNGPGGTGPNGPGGTGPNGPGGTGPNNNVGPNGPGGTGPNGNNQPGGNGPNTPGGTGPDGSLPNNGELIPLPDPGYGAYLITITYVVEKERKLVTDVTFIEKREVLEELAAKDAELHPEDLDILNDPVKAAVIYIKLDTPEYKEIFSDKFNFPAWAKRFRVTIKTAVGMSDFWEIYELEMREKVGATDKGGSLYLIQLYWYPEAGTNKETPWYTLVSIYFPPLDSVANQNPPPAPSDGPVILPLPQPQLSIIDVYLLSTPQIDYNVRIQLVTLKTLTVKVIEINVLLTVVLRFSMDSYVFNHDPKLEKKPKEIKFKVSFTEKRTYTSGGTWWKQIEKTPGAPPPGQGSYIPPKAGTGVKVTQTQYAPAVSSASYQQHSFQQFHRPQYQQTYPLYGYGYGQKLPSANTFVGGYGYHYGGTTNVIHVKGSVQVVSSGTQITTVNKYGQVVSGGGNVVTVNQKGQVVSGGTTSVVTVQKGQVVSGGTSVVTVQKGQVVSGGTSVVTVQKGQVVSSTTSMVTANQYGQMVSGYGNGYTYGTVYGYQPPKGNSYAVSYGNGGGYQVSGGSYQVSGGSYQVSGGSYQVSAGGFKVNVGIKGKSIGGPGAIDDSTPVKSSPVLTAHYGVRVWGTASTKKTVKVKGRGIEAGHASPAAKVGRGIARQRKAQMETADAPTIQAGRSIKGRTAQAHGNKGRSAPKGKSAKKGPEIKPGGKGVFKGTDAPPKGKSVNKDSGQKGKKVVAAQKGKGANKLPQGSVNGKGVHVDKDSAAKKV